MTSRSSPGAEAASRPVIIVVPIVIMPHGLEADRNWWERRTPEDRDLVIPDEPTQTRPIGLSRRL